MQSEQVEKLLKDGQSFIAQEKLRDGKPEQTCAVWLKLSRTTGKPKAICATIKKSR